MDDIMIYITSEREREVSWVTQKLNILGNKSLRNKIQLEN